MYHCIQQDNKKKKLFFSLYFLDNFWSWINVINATQRHLCTFSEPANQMIHHILGSFTILNVFSPGCSANLAEEGYHISKTYILPPSRAGLSKKREFAFMSSKLTKGAATSLISVLT